MKFTKMHGVGNDYIYVNAFKEQIEDPSAVSVFVSDRHFGIGGDGLIIIGPSKVADCCMEMYNADGSLGLMCGNGIRCVAKYVYDNGICKKDELKIETASGVKTVFLTIDNGQVSSVRVNMGSPILTASAVPVTFPKERMINEPMEVNGQIYNVTCVSMGNPHCVIFMDEDVRKLNLPAIGPSFEHHAIFPKRINTEFINVIDRKHLRMRVWERGSGETLACGTGACAAAVASVINGLSEKTVEISLTGGKLTVNYDTDEDAVYMSGPATTVFTGEIEIPMDFSKEDVRIY